MIERSGKVMGLRVLGSLLAFVAAMTLPRPVWADCAVPEAASAWPHGGTAAPRNTHVWVFIPPASPEGIWISHHENGSHELALTVRAASTRGKADAGRVDFERRDAAAYEQTVVELVPKTPLQTGRKYTVEIAVPGGEAHPVGSFVVGENDDVEAPRWEGILGATVERLPVAECEPEISATIVLGETCDGTDGLRYLAWVTRGDGPIEYRRPPDAWLHSRARENMAMGPEAAPFIRLEPGRNFALPPLGTVWRVGIRAVDLAGHLSEPSEVRLTGVLSAAQQGRLPTREVKTYPATAPATVLTPRSEAACWSSAAAGSPRKARVTRQRASLWSGALLTALAYYSWWRRRARRGERRVTRRAAALWCLGALGVPPLFVAASDHVLPLVRRGDPNAPEVYGADPTDDGSNDHLSGLLVRSNRITPETHPFGMSFVLRGAPRGGVVPLQIRLTHPPLKSRFSPVPTVEDRWNIEATIGEEASVNASMRRGDESEGRWTIQVWYGDDQLLQRTFDVAKERDNRPKSP